MKKIIFGFCFCTTFGSLAQSSIQKQIYSSGGRTVSNTTHSLNTTIGEPIIAKYISTNEKMYNGYQHSKKGSLNINEEQILYYYFYPNPTKNIVYLNIKSSFEVENLHINITDINGKIISTKKDFNGMNLLTHFDLSKFPNGNYFIQFEQGNKKLKSIKIIKQ